MRKIFVTIVLLAGILVSCDSSNKKQSFEKVKAESLFDSIEHYINCKIEIEGKIVHICGVDAKKMKLQMANGEIVKIVPLDSTIKFNSDYYKKSICVQGVLLESKLEIQTIDSLEKEKSLLCHIDRTPCKDKKWVENQVKKGISDSLSKRDIAALKKKMQQTGATYISTLTIVAETIVIKDQEKNGQ